MCAPCNQPAELVDSAKIYGPGTYYGKFWHCEHCKAYVGVHKDTDQPLGTLANKDLRSWRQKAHEYFDPKWKKKAQIAKISISKAKNLGYEWLAKQLDYTRAECHIAMFNVAECKQVIQICGGPDMTQAIIVDDRSVGCTSCGTQIIFLKTSKGKKMPVDATSVKDNDHFFDHKRHTSHFSTCTNPKKHRKPR